VKEGLPDFAYLQINGSYGHHDEERVREKNITGFRNDKAMPYDPLMLKLNYLKIKNSFYGQI
jgi:hypothetical protein